MALSHVLTGTLQGLGQIKLPVIATLIGALVKIPVNYVLIAMPSVNILGVVIGTIVCFMVSAGINMYFLYRCTGILPSLSAAFIKPLVAAAGMGMVCYAVYHTAKIFMPSALATIGALCAGGVTYVLFMCVIKGFRQSDLQAMPLPRKIKILLQSL
jgi:stage V sporulation protein B